MIAVVRGSMIAREKSLVNRGVASLDRLSRERSPVLVSCSNCQGRFRVAAERIPPSGARARCSRCSTILFIRPKSDGAIEEIPSASAPPPIPAPEAPPPPLPPAAGEWQGPPGDPGAGEVEAAQGAEEAWPSPPAEPPPAFDPFASLGGDDDPFAAVSAASDEDDGPPVGVMGGAFAPTRDIPGREAQRPLQGEEPAQRELEDEEREAPFPQLSTVRRAPSPDAQQQRMRLRPMVRVMGERKISTIFWGAVVAAGIAFGVVVGLERDPMRLARSIGLSMDPGPLIVRGDELAMGLHPTRSGERLLYVAGVVHREAEAGGAELVKIDARVLGHDGAELGRSEGWAGASPTPEELHRVEDDRQWRALSALLRERAITSLGGGELPFVIAFPGVDPSTAPLRFEIAASSFGPDEAPPSEESREPESVVDAASDEGSDDEGAER